MTCERHRFFLIQRLRLYPFFEKSSYSQGTKYRYLLIYQYLDFTEISEISENIGGYFDKNIGNAKINKNTLKFMEILC